MRKPARRALLIAWRRSKGPAILVVLSIALGGVVVSGVFGIRAVWANRTLIALLAGHDIPVSAAMPFEVEFGRAIFLLRHDRLDEAQRWMDEIAAAARPADRATLYYDLANARLRAAFALIEQNQIDAAAAEVRLAKEGYRKALTLEPQFWNAKYNLDVAMRLVRDFPQMADEVLEEAPGELPKHLWTDLPRMPQGLP